ncbi:MAG: hypothetical protein H0T46_30805 [Deltaproteobacteria bacterium]|nr:hypothetical protein [Deltaproteobacteria bacterium]
MAKLVRGLGFALVVGCSSPKSTQSDAREPDVAADAAADVAIDVMVDAAIDVPVDVPIDGPSSSPRCAAGATIALDVSPLKITTMARSGSTLYVSTYDPANFGQGTLYTFDLTTHTQTAAPFVTTGILQVGESPGDVFAAEPSAGRIWQLHPGAAPQVLVSDRVDPWVPVADSTHVYWAELTPTSSGRQVVRSAIAGGPVEPLMACQAYQLAIVGQHIYCAGQNGVRRHRTDGTGATEFISYAGISVVFALAAAGTDAVFAPFGAGSTLFRVDSTTTAATAITPISGPRNSDVATSSDYFYLLDLTSAVRRIHRTTAQEELVYSSGGGRPVPQQWVVLWNEHLYFDAQDSQLGGTSYLMHCVD